MILFVFEGADEKSLFNTLLSLYFPKDVEKAICLYKNNIYNLYKEIKGFDGAGDLVSILADRYRNQEDNPFENRKRSDFSEIYLFFDYDFQNKNIPLKEINFQLNKMLEFFSDETDNGKLYVNYPMIESIRYTQKLPDKDYFRYTVSRTDCCHFKNLANNFSAYKSLDFIILPENKDLEEEQKQKIKRNWEHLKSMNVCKAHYICKGSNLSPKNIEDISQSDIFSNQLSKYVTPTDSISILNSFPIFLWEYFPQKAE